MPRLSPRDPSPTEGRVVRSVCNVTRRQVLCLAILAMPTMPAGRPCCGMCAATVPKHPRRYYSAVVFMGLCVHDGGMSSRTCWQYVYPTAVSFPGVVVGWLDRRLVEPIVSRGRSCRWVGRRTDPDVQDARAGRRSRQWRCNRKSRGASMSNERRSCVRSVARTLAVQMVRCHRTVQLCSALSSV